MAIQHLRHTDRAPADIAADESGDPQTIVILVTVLPVAAVDDLATIASTTIAGRLGEDRIVDVSRHDGSTIAIRLRATGDSGARVADPALAPVLEAELSAALRAAGHANVSIGMVSAGPPRSSAERAADLWQKLLVDLKSQSLRLAEDGSFRTEIARLVENGEIRTVFQPIVGAKYGRTLGYEALSRGPVGHRLERPDLLLAAADRAGLSSLVQWEMLRLARLRAAERLNSPDRLLFVNAPDTRFWPDARVEVADGGTKLWPWDRLVSEVSERTPIVNLPAVWEARDRGRDRGIRYALDDVGAGNAGLAALALLAPDYVKIDMAIIRDCHRDQTKQAVIAGLVQYALRSEAMVIAEGVETSQELSVVRSLGVEWIQGFLIAEPTEVPTL